MKKWLAIILLLLGIGSYAVQAVHTVYQDRLLEREIRKKEIALDSIRDTINKSFRTEEDLPTQVWHEGEEYTVEYTFDEKLTSWVRRLLRRYRSDHSAIVVMDNETGEILAAQGYQRDEKRFSLQLPYTSTHPAASIIKLITSAELIENAEVVPSTTFNFLGRGTTLYKYQLKPIKRRRARTQSFMRAFAYSNNVIFGKAAINKSSGVGLFNMANGFGFNRQLMKDIDLSPSIFPMPDSSYNLAEMASGFNRKTMISPVHAAALSTVVPNNGAMKMPSIIKNIKNVSTGELLWRNTPEANPVVSPETAHELKKLMKTTITNGTARGSFARLPYKLRKKLEIGGKTGSITGGIPHGKRDWFVSFASPKDERFGKGISVSVMNVNNDLWYVKSAYLAKEIIRYYFSSINQMNEDMTLVDQSHPDKKASL